MQKTYSNFNHSVMKTMSLTKLFFGFLLLFNMAAQAQWVRVNSSQNIDFYGEISVLSENELVLNKSVALKKSSDGGLTWFDIGAGIQGSILDLKFITPQIGFLVAVDGNNIKRIHKSIDGGTTWVSIM
jgi:photosystem II stability/assembly factor-like uncharacterized protein